MTSHVAWNDIRAEHVARAGGEAAVEAGKREMLAEVIGHRLAEIRRTRGLTQQQVADRMGVTKGRVSQIERGKISGQDVLARYATALGGRLHQAIYFDDGDITAIAQVARRLSRPTIADHRRTRQDVLQSPGTMSSAPCRPSSISRPRRAANSPSAELLLP
jgi:transcriptional regulator with XRE-family HTH domain